MGASSGAGLGIAGDDRGPPRASRLEPREGDVERSGEGERGQRRSDRDGEEEDPEIQDHTRPPAREGGPPPSRRRLEEVGRGVGASPHDEGIGDHDAEEGDEQAADQEEESSVGTPESLAGGEQEPGRGGGAYGGFLLL